MTQMTQKSEWKESGHINIPVLSRPRSRVAIIH